jgi:signal transduction histidine kinase
MTTKQFDQKSNPRILIVDDDEGIRFALESLLTLDNYEFASAENGMEGLKKVMEFKPDVILLDVMMPGMDGFEVCRRLKENVSWRQIPVIMITALDSREDLASSLDAGADEFLSKPVESVELRARVRSMLRIKHQYDDLEHLLQMRDDLENLVVHEMRSPLLNIIGASENLLSADINPDDRRWVERIYTQSQKINNQLTDILLLAKMERGQLSLDLNEINIADVIYDGIQNQTDIAKARRINIRTELSDELCKLKVDEHLIARVLDNLINNALKFSDLQTTVTIRTTPFLDGGQRWCRIQVIDEGPGLPAEAHERIFKKYDIIALRQHGITQVGLGLAFCKLVVDMHGGRIFMEDNKPRGAIINVELLSI